MEIQLNSAKADIDIAIIIINYNSSNFTINCVDSIFKYTSSNIKFEVVIVDNNSNENDYNKLSVLTKYENLKIVKSRINLGFGGGHMFGTEFTHPRYYFFLNNDCLFLNDCLSVLYTFCIEHPNTGLCSPQLFTKNMERHSSFSYLPTLSSKLLGFGFLRMLDKDKYPLKLKEYDKPVKVQMVSGSTMFVNADAFNKIGGFDTIYFLYCEEEDLSLRLSKSGYEIFLLPDARIQHFIHGSTIKNLDITKEYYISLFYFYNKHYGFIKTQFLKIYFYIKIIKRSFRDFNNFKLSFFILFNAKLQNSLRHKQTLN